VGEDVTPLSQAWQETLLLWLRHLPAEQNLTLIVLKGHLLVEQHLLDIVRSRVAEPAALDDTNLGLWRLARLARALVADAAPVAIWTAIDRLNRLRNELAHHIEPPAIQALAQAFIDAIPVSIELPAPFAANTLEERVKVALGYISGVLFGLARIGPANTALHPTAAGEP
jgi:hypothetical protein